MSVIKLRSAPLNVLLSSEAKVMFKLTDRWNPTHFIDNKYEENKNTVIDHATGLRWQKSGSGLLSHDKIKNYINQLNNEKYAGCDGWRLPTTEELLSLFEPEKQPNGLYLSTVFDATLSLCWGADNHNGYPWNANFNRQRIHNENKSVHYVKAVRTED